MKRIVAGGAIVIAGLGTALGLTLSSAGAGISAAGYAQTAQHALQKEGGQFGYTVRCRGVQHYPTANITVTCIMTGK